MEIATRRSSVRRPNWEHPPTPRIIQLPRRPCARRKSTKNRRREVMENMFDRRSGFLARGRGGATAAEVTAAAAEEEKWMLEVEMLRAECKMLKVEKEVVAKTVERKREKIDRTLQSAVHILLAGRERISEGKDVSYVLEEEIDHLIEKLQRLRRKQEAKDSEVKNCSNFDKQASLLKRRLEKFDDASSEICPRVIRETAEASLSTIPSQCPNRSCFSDGDSNMEILRRKMETFSKGNLLERIEKDYGSLISFTNGSVTCSSSGSKRINNVHSKLQRSYKEMRPHEEKLCSGHCKVIVKKLVDQVKVEIEQWSQMQEMLDQVKAEMKELHSSKDYWEDRTLILDHQIRSLRVQVQEWREKANFHEKAANELQAEVLGLKQELKKTTNNSNLEEKEENLAQRISKEPQRETILGILVRRLKENHRMPRDSGLKQKNRSDEGRKGEEIISSSEVVALKRSPLRDIGNVSSLKAEKQIYSL